MSSYTFKISTATPETPSSQAQHQLSEKNQTKKKSSIISQRGVRRQIKDPALIWSQKQELPAPFHTEIA